MKGWDSKRMKEEKAKMAALFLEQRQEQHRQEEALKKAKEDKAAQDEAERDEIFKLVRESQSGSESGVFTKRRRSMSKDHKVSIPEGTRFATERLSSPKSIETDTINSLTSSKSQNASGAKSSSGNAAKPPSPKSPQSPSSQRTQQSRRQRRASTGSMDLPPSQEEVRRLSSFKDAPVQASNSDVLEQVKQKLREQKERDAEKEARRKAMEAEKEAEAAAYAKEASSESNRASPTASRARAKAAAKTAGGVFLEKREYGALLSRIRSLETEVANYAAGIEGPQVKVASENSLTTSLARTFSPSLARSLSPSLARVTRSLSPSTLFRANSSKPSDFSLKTTIRPPNRTSSSYWNGLTETADGDTQQTALKVARWDGRGNLW